MRQFLSGMLVGAALAGLGTFVPSFASSLFQGTSEAEERLPRHTLSDARRFNSDLASLDSLAAPMDFAMTRDLIDLGLPDLSLQSVIQEAFPARTSSISVVAESYGDCDRLVQIIQTPNGGKPKVVSRTSGHCDASPDVRLPRDSVSGTGDKPIAIPMAIPATAAPGAAL